MLTRLPSGADVKVSVRIVSPIDGAISSLSIADIIAFVASPRAFASGVETSASSWARSLASGAGGRSGQPPITALMRGSIRGSAMSLAAMCSSVCRPA